MQSYDVKIRWTCGLDETEGCDYEFESTEPLAEWDQGATYVECPQCGMCLDSHYGIPIERGKPKKIDKKRKVVYSI